MNINSWLILLGVALVSSVHATVYYVDAAGGDDARDGVKPRSAWCSLDKVNQTPLVAGDSVLFHRAQTWRGQLRPKSGSSLGVITYGAYDSGAKPMILGSVQANHPDSWIEAGQDLWVTAPANITPLSVDVGNIIFDEGKSIGIKKWHLTDLRQEGDYYYYARNSNVTLRCAQNPAVRFKNIELALNRHIINQDSRSWVTYEDLDLRYGAAHGIGGSSTHHITVRRCDLSYIGGGHQTTMANGKPVRFGNGVEFWSSAHDCLVEDCRIWEIYDAALTNQGDGTNVQENITYRGNVIWNSEYSFEFWNRGPASQTRNIIFEHNTCVNAGYGWGHAQRPDPNGRHLMFWDNSSITTNVVVRLNIFCRATDSLVWLQGRDWTSALRMDNNAWFQDRAPMLMWGNQTIGKDGFLPFLQTRGFEIHTCVNDPGFINPQQLDYRLSTNSPLRKLTSPSIPPGALP